ncbi:Periplasmic oligopeptide-binding protein precursor [Piscirickettsia salmonis]|uniref:peptide ABC transporter substrate-binding protein n=2 Tax=Piscirickettsia salmonis TaxID=1238 RepID=UPI0012B8983E|nr:Periplasmic oligopeptide-binding protein precursor [Piscirickettsia salmonis]
MKKSVRYFLLVASVLSFALCSMTASANTTVENVLIKGNGAEPGSIDPQKVEGVPGSTIVLDLFEGLTIEGPNGDILPGVAKSWVVSNDHLVYTFKLRQKAKWSNGKPVTAADFVYGMQRAEDPKTASTYAYLLYPIKNAKKINEGKLPLEDLAIKALDDYTLQITLNAPTPYFLAVLSQPTAAPAYQPAVEKSANNYTKPGYLISNGAYELTDWVVNGHILLKKNPHYWNAKRVQIDQVKYLPIVETTTAVKMYEGGQLQWTASIPSNQYRVLKAKYGSQVHTAPYLGLYYYDFNMQQAPFKDNLKLRKALTMAVDRTALTKYVLGQGQIPAYSYVPEGTNGIEFTQYDWATWPRAKQIATAKALFKEAGYSAERPLAFTISYNTLEDHKKVALAVMSMWQQVFGPALDVKIENQEWKVFLATRQRGEYQVARDGWIGDYNYATSFLELYQCGNPQNNSHYCNSKVNESVEKAAISNTDAERLLLNTEAEKIAMADYPIIPLYQYAALHMIKPEIKGYTGHNVLDHIRTADLALEK